MQVSRGALSCLLSLSILGSAGSAHAALVSVSFAGEIESVPASATGALALVMEGDPFLATFHVDLNRARLTIVGDDLLFQDAIFPDSFALQVGDLAFAAAPGAVATLFARDSASGATDFLLSDFQFAQTASSPAERLQIDFLFENFAGTLFDGSGQPLLPTNLSIFDRATLRIFARGPGMDGVGAPVTGTIRSASVPEPGTLASLTLGLCALQGLLLQASRSLRIAKRRPHALHIVSDTALLGRAEVRCRAFRSAPLHLTGSPSTGRAGARTRAAGRLALASTTQAPLRLPDPHTTDPAGATWGAQALGQVSRRCFS